MPRAKKVKGFMVYIRSRYGNFNAFIEGADRIEAIKIAHQIARERLFLFICDYDLETKAVF